ncbi:hypothetical protein AVEN_181310-1 [Araneus ventricosus]|uniref:Uncharacterized protein n=1 Tax=Araneus ventricosus TaxID=182803 RepID=A0A4Y2EHE4_ARAVE|nr:hypothetical protein AVEN_181310-1 [Araneus ventricosus]
MTHSLITKSPKPLGLETRNLAGGCFLGTLWVCKSYSTVSNDAIQILCSCPPLDIKISVETGISVKLKSIKTDLYVEGKLNFECVEERRPWEMTQIEWVCMSRKTLNGRIEYLLMGLDRTKEWVVSLCIIQTDLGSALKSLD